MNKRFKKIYVEISNICNLNCSFCLEDSREKKIMNKDEFNIVINKIKEYTNLITFHVKGEPLLHPELKNLLKICEENNVKVNITTNGYLLKENLDIILNSPAIRQINISLHSILETQNNKIPLEEYLNNILFSSKEILSKTNIILSYRLWNLSNIKNNDINKNILTKIGTYFKFDKLFENAKNNEFIKIKENLFLNQDIEFNWPNINGSFISNTGNCQGLKSQIAILSNGTVVPCCLDQDGIINLGNLFNESFEEILNKEKTKSIVKGFNENKLVEELCQKCEYREKFN